jgi:hypothetical protein
MDPPSLSAKVIRNLGEKFYKVALETLSDAVLCAPKTSNRVIGAKPKKKDDKASAPGRKSPKPDDKSVSNGRIIKKDKKTVKK